MIHFPEPPGKKLTNFLSDIGTARSTREFQQLFLENIGRLMENDHISCWFSYDSHVARGEQKDVAPLIPLLVCTAASHVHEKAVREYNEHYRELVPLLSPL